MRKHGTLPILLSVLLLLTDAAFARAGGGSNSGGGGIVQLILLPFILAYSAYVTYKLKQKSKECSSLLHQIGHRETGWDLETLKGISSRLFMGVQEAWCKQDVTELRRLTKGSARAELVHKLDELTDKGRQNHMDDLQITAITVLNVQNFLDDEQDNFTVRVEAKARDYTTDGSGRIVEANTRKRKTFSDPTQVPAEPFAEFWTFEREGDDWVLLELAQSSAWKSTVSRPMFDEGGAGLSPTPAGGQSVRPRADLGPA